MEKQYTKQGYTFKNVMGHSQTRTYDSLVRMLALENDVLKTIQDNIAEIEADIKIIDEL